MKVIAFNGSPRSAGNTAQSLKIVLSQLEQEGIETEIIQLGGTKVYGCLSCRKCAQNKNKRCTRNDDDMNIYIEKMISADGIIIGSPTYFSNVSSEVKALIDRSGCVSKVNGGLYKGKIGTAVVSARRSGASFVYSAINFFFGVSEMIIPSSFYWNMTLSKEPGDIENDEEGIRIFQTLGKNIASTLRKIHQ